MAVGRACSRTETATRSGRGIQAARSSARQCSGAPGAAAACRATRPLPVWFVAPRRGLELTSIAGIHPPRPTRVAVRTASR